MATWHELMKIPKARTLVAGRYVPASAENGWRYTEPASVNVAVLDNGCDIEHPNLASVINAEGSLSFEGGSPVKNGTNSHGTLCAGLIGGSAEGQFLGGVATSCVEFTLSLFGARYAPSDNFNDDEQMFRELCGRGARVISCSWGYGPGYFSENKKAAQKAYKMRDLIKELSAQTVFVFAAGNENEVLAGKDVLFAEDAILVGSTLNATGGPEVKSGRSNYGPGITVCAPGSDDSGIRPVSTSNTGQGEQGLSGNRNFDYHGNTSAACPMVAGVVALMLLANPKLTPKQVKTLLCLSADKIDATCTHAAGKWKTAAGSLTSGQLASFDHTSFTDNVKMRPYSGFYGFGRVNAKAAVTLVLQELDKGL